jgi:cytochrome c556
VCFNFPFAYFTQLFFIQPLVRVLFKLIFAKQIKARADKANEAENNGLEKDRPTDETEAIADIWKRMDEISEQLAHEHRQRKKLQAKIEQNEK